MGTAGLLPSQRPECEYSPFEDYAYVNELEIVWERMQVINVMENNAWQSFRVRPSNSPLRRIAGMCLLVRRYREKGLLAGLMELVRDSPGGKWLSSFGRRFDGGLMMAIGRVGLISVKGIRD